MTFSIRRTAVPWLCIARTAIVILPCATFVVACIDAAYSATATTEPASSVLLSSIVSFVAGLVLAGASYAALMALRPRNGKTHRLATMPVLAPGLPIAIMSGLVFGVALIITSIARLF
jgi:hypothetical protein